MRNWLARLVVLAGIAAVFLSGCAGLGGLVQKPEVSLAGWKLVQLGLFEQRFALQLRIRNPNDVELPINGLSFAIEVNGQPFLKGVSDKALTVARFGEGLLEVTATGTLGNTLKQFRELQKGGRDRVDYRISGRINLVNLGSLPFERHGDLQLPMLEAAPRKALSSALPPGGERI